MKTPYVYVDLSIIKGVYEEEFAVYTKLFFGCVLAGDYKIIVSDILDQELEKEGKTLLDFYYNLPATVISRVEIDSDAKELAEEYLKAGIPGIVDPVICKHIAIASTCRADIFLSWDYRSVVNIKIKNVYNSVNLLNNTPLLEIRDPRALIGING